MYINNRQFEWDEHKAQLNIQKHGVHFLDAAFSFDDPNALTIPDEKHSFLEQRQLLIGSNDKEILVVVFTIRLVGTIRIISARRPNKKEVAIYEKRKKG